MAELKILKNVLDANDSIARSTRELLTAKGIFTLNLISSPGAGKTACLETLIRSCAGRLKLAVLEGDVATANDAERVHRHGVSVVQINTEPTGGDCHLGAEMVRDALGELELDGVDLLVIENVGNLICPMSFDLGEDRKVIVLSITEGEDKPIKYPLTFRDADAVWINKIDAAEALGENVDRYEAHVRQVNPDCPLFRLSARTGEGFPQLVDWLTGEVEKKRG